MNKYLKKEQMSTFAKSMIAFSILLLATIIVVVVTFGGKPAGSDDTPKNFINNAMQFQEPGKLSTFPATPMDDYAPTEETADPTDIILTVFADYACPHCQDFEKAVGNDIDMMLQDGTLTELRLAPVSYQPIPYAPLSHMAIVCIADMEPAKTFDAHKALMNVGAEGGTSFKMLMTELDEATGSPLETDTKLCIKNNQYQTFTGIQNVAAQDGGFFPLLNEGISGTPSVFINDQKYSGQPDPQVLALAINWVKAGGILAELEANPAMADNLDLTDPANPKIAKGGLTEPADKETAEAEQE